MVQWVSWVEGGLWSTGLPVSQWDGSCLGRKPATSPVWTASGKVQQATDGVSETAIVVVKIPHSLCIYHLETVRFGPPWRYHDINDSHFAPVHELHEKQSFHSRSIILDSLCQNHRWKWAEWVCGVQLITSPSSSPPAKFGMMRSWDAQTSGRHSHSFSK